jgi:hypothetical protein
MAPPKRSNFSVRVVLPASGWAITANVLRLVISSINAIVKVYLAAKIHYAMSKSKRLSFKLEQPLSLIKLFYS